MSRHQEPTLSVGLVDRSDSASVRLEGVFLTPDGRAVGPGEIRVTCRDGGLHCRGVTEMRVEELQLAPSDPQACRFLLEATIGIDFHWEQKETQAFLGGLRIVPQDRDRMTVVNHVPLETYLTSVICSEMNAASPTELAKAHAVISRSWLLAQLDAREEKGVVPTPTTPFEDSERATRQEESALIRNPPPPSAGCPVFGDGLEVGERIRWTDREAHTDFDVCADDHCQRYQGIGRVESAAVAAAIADTRGQALVFEGRACDARYSKCCGGVTEEFQTAWGDEKIPYLVAVADSSDGEGPLPQLIEETAVRRFIDGSPAAYCNCTDESILRRVLNDYDQTTHDFFRWKIRIEAARATDLLSQKLGIGLGRLLALEPLARGPSGRLKRLRLTGETGSLVIGKELEIRRALSTSHLYSSAFVVDTEGPTDQPDAFVLSGAGWGHGVGLCQIGAAVMACRGAGYEEILRHYYPGTEIEQLYEERSDGVME